MNGAEELTGPELPEQQTVQLLCGCGWGHLAIPVQDIPQDCPVCGFDLWAHFGLD